MDITKTLQETDKSLVLHNEGDWSNPVDPQKPGFTSFNDAGVETETGEFLYSMVRILKPEFVLETGTHWGVGASYMGQALKDNHAGHLTTIEFLPENWRLAVERMARLGLSDVVDCVYMDVAQYDPGLDLRGSNESMENPPKKQYKLILLDTEPQTRFAELLKFYDNLEEGGFIFIHDLHRHMHQIENADHGFAWPYGVLPEEIKELVKADKLRPFHFSTPRGLTGFYKVSKSDYQFFDVAKNNENAWKYEELSK